MRFFNPKHLFCLLLTTVLWLGCAKTPIHLHDRHVLSFGPIESYLKSNSDATLILFDYHHDSGPLTKAPTSFSWLGDLLVEFPGLRVKWISGRNLKLPNKNSRLSWLTRSMKSNAPSTSQSLMNRISIIDFEDLLKESINGRIIISIDLDILTKDPGPSPTRFVDEMVAYAKSVHPDLVTIAFSSAYQPDPKSAWLWLDQIVSAPWGSQFQWYFEGGDFGPIAESIEESKAWSKWDSEIGTFHVENPFWPGPSLWYNAPEHIRSEMSKPEFVRVDDGARSIAAHWENLSRYESHKNEIDLMAKYAMALAKQTIFGRLDLNPSPELLSEPLIGKNYGLAVRLFGPNGDRGCLAYYRDVSDIKKTIIDCALGAMNDPRYVPVNRLEIHDLVVEISVFCDWLNMKDPKDFVPGSDSLLLESEGQTTLLQASLVPERPYNKIKFLEALCKKAGLDKDDWKNLKLVSFKKATTFWYLEQLGP